MKTFLISRLRFMGDVILTTPVIQAVMEACPDAVITYLAEAPFHTLIEHHPMVSRVLGFERKLVRQIPLIREIVRGPFDVAIDLLGNPRSAILNALSGASMRIGGDFRGRRILYTHRITDDTRPKSAVAFHMQYLLPLGIHREPAQPRIYLKDEEVLWAHDYLNRLGYSGASPVIGIHSGASWPAKRWLPDRFARLAEHLHDEGAQVILTMGPGDRQAVQEVIDHSRIPLKMPDILSLRELASVLSICRVFVSNDCGPMHIAPAVGTKTVGIFGPGEPEIWFPYSAEKGHRVVHKEISCSHCHKDLCSDMACMKAVTVEEVLRVVRDVL